MMVFGSHRMPSRSAWRSHQMADGDRARHVCQRAVRENPWTALATNDRTDQGWTRVAGLFQQQRTRDGVLLAANASDTNPDDF